MLESWTIIGRVGTTQSWASHRGSFRKLPTRKRREERWTEGGWLYIQCSVTMVLNILVGSVEHTGLDGGGREESELAVASDQEGCSAAFTKRGCKVKMET